ncbi:MULTISPECIES: non-ribosomal peptide synthetase [unclassified Photorhabdus]|uniref:non-ribosomal peptide synthetase n=1 Tax=unclassified Photorhabdus TaxID=2620880 RepID=UPI000DCB4F63|nr:MULTISPECIES: non-ribosomal peptide synthetase [unclassified Photorhabdus]RAX03729.1 hypothetical protein CKY03_02140 [Photorhabdus sp. S9-53]RAX04042.1 hypothetical protein CKY05_02140 [Photorhabdus sp. S10-54]RAX06078.1 hypothetical protein CKY04_02140 [Photorhabdus sp. S8-52]
MRILNILTGAHLDQLSSHVVRYLLDAGHFVYVVADDVEQQAAWQAAFKHNFMLISHEHIADYAIDCEFCYGMMPAISAATAIKLVAFNQEEAALFQVVGEHGGSWQILAEKKLAWEAHRSVQAHELLAELFIDGLITFCRYDLEHTPQWYPSKNDISLWYQAQEQMRNRQWVFAEQSQHYTCFVLQDEINLEQSEREIVTLPVTGIFQQEDVALLALLLQFLFNARRSALYSFDWNHDQRWLNHYQLLTGVEKYVGLRNEIDCLWSGELDNPFYDPLSVSSALPVPGVAVFVDCQPNWDQENLNLSLNWHSVSQSLTLNFRQGIPFFSAVADYIAEFMRRLPDFKQGKVSFMALAQLPENLLQRYYYQNNQTQCDYPHTTIPALFEQQVNLAPDHPAVLTEQVAMSYGELNQRANQLASYMMRHYCLEIGDRVAIMMSREADLFVALLAILKLGCAYVPIDTQSPAIRTYSILEDAQPVLLLTSQPVPTGFLPQGVQHLYLNSQAGSDIFSDEPTSNPELTVQPHDLAYVTYTSGTTGKPKGVAIEHGNLLNVFNDVQRRIALTAQDRFLAITTLAFDICKLEIFMPLMFGATVVLADQRQLLETNRLKHYLETYRVSLMQGTPSFWQQIILQMDGQFLPVRAICGGEAVSNDLARRLAKMTIQTWNMYGPTETCVWSTGCLLNVEQSQVLIGKPIANTQCYVLDESGRPVPPGVIGELHISGAGVARGYFGNPQLTRSQFIPNPFYCTGKNWPGPIMYKTGDRVRYLPCGNLEYISRVDNQIKLRGHRIELGEIESVLQQYPGIQRAVVALQQSVTPGGEPFLAAYYQANAPLDRQLLTDFFAPLLPDYMLPSTYMFLANIPLNANGKVDRKALPAIQLHEQQHYVAPYTECQRILCRIFSQVLGDGQTQIGITDDFFSLGGSSLSAIHLVNQINSELNCNLKIRDIFQQKMISRLVPLVEVGRGEFMYRDYLIKRTDLEHRYHPFPLNNVQQTYYLGRFKSFELSEVSTHIYSEFVFGQLDHRHLELTFNQLISRHPSLCTIFENGEQRYLNSVPYYNISYRQITTDTEFMALREQFSHKVYAPERYPLFDILLSEYAGKYILHISFDAIIIDMTSFEILFSEWIQLYQQPELPLPVLDITYRDYHLQYERARNSALFTQAENYWRQKASSISLEMNLPLAIRPAVMGKPHFQRISGVIPQSIWQKLLDKCQHYSISPTALIVELYSRTLCYWAGQEQICLNLTRFNRLPLHPQVNQIIGDFTVLSLFAYQNRTDISICQQLEQVHGALLQDIEHNLFDGVDVQRMLKQQRELSANTVIAPVMLTSVLGMNSKASMFELPLDESYQGMQYSISQTSQVWLNHKAYETDEGFVAEWDYVEQLFAADTIKAMHDSYCQLIRLVAERDWQQVAFPTPALPVAQSVAQ